MRVSSINSQPMSASLPDGTREVTEEEARKLLSAVLQASDKVLRKLAEYDALGQ